MERIIFALGGAAIGAIAGLSLSGIESKNKEVNYKKMLLFEPEHFSVNPHCAELFIRLQQYRDCSYREFDFAGDDTDSLFNIISVLSQEEVEWSEKLAKDANAYYLRIVKNLDTFKNNIEYRLITLPNSYYRDLPENQPDSLLDSMEKRIENGIENFNEITGLIDGIKSILHGYILRISSGLTM